MPGRISRSGCFFSFLFFSTLGLDDRVVADTFGRSESTGSTLGIEMLDGNLVMMLPLTFPFFVYIPDSDRVTDLCTEQIPASKDAFNRLGSLGPTSCANNLVALITTYEFPQSTSWHLGTGTPLNYVNIANMHQACNRNHDLLYRIISTHLSWGSSNRAK